MSCRTIALTARRTIGSNRHRVWPYRSWHLFVASFGSSLNATFISVQTALKQKCPRIFRAANAFARGASQYRRAPDDACGSFWSDPHGRDARGMSASELGVLTSQCLNRRIPNKQILIEEIAAWEHCRFRVKPPLIPG